MTGDIRKTWTKSFEPTEIRPNYVQIIWKTYKTFLKLVFFDDRAYKNLGPFALGPP